MILFTLQHPETQLTFKMLVCDLHEKYRSKLAPKATVIAAKEVSDTEHRCPFCERE